eukprot:TRINITY_DN140_c1_g1_i2.p1 TRINITY_DN140_c1_g1~~TRINITY_DN140_c1_g1_i2.p1  ORF type:complete len:625 (+),score=68.21 TRINITY_DN140_c1_g1_i2:8802-10676(+)
MERKLFKEYQREQQLRMEGKARDGENKCATGDKKPVKSYCQRCKVYICTDCHVTKHIDHDSEVIDLAEKATRFLAEYQKLYRAAILMSDRRQVHIKDESIDSIVNDLKSRLVKAKESLQGDINKSVEATTKYLPTSPLLKDFLRKKSELGGKPEDPLIKLKQELSKACAELLHHITQSRYESADKFLSPEVVKKYEEEIEKMNQLTAGDMDYIQELAKLKKTQIEYSYDPMTVLGMIKVETKAKKPDRVIQFDRERNVLNIYNVAGKKATAAKVEAGFMLPFRFISIETANNVYLIGGDNDHGYYLKSMYLYDELRGVLIALANMIEARSRHAAVSDGDNIYVIGGENSEGVLGSCEKYEIKENAWKALPQLKEKRCGLSACILDRYIYAGFGWDKEYINTIERLELTRERAWETIKLSKKHRLPALQAPGIVQTKENEMMIFGGYKEDEELTAETIILDTKNNTIKKGKGLGEVEAFISSEVKKIGEVVYAFGYTKGGLHTYDIEKDEWGFIAQDQIPVQLQSIQFTFNHIYWVMMDSCQNTNKKYINVVQQWIKIRFYKSLAVPLVPQGVFLLSINSQELRFVLLKLRKARKEPQKRLRIRYTASLKQDQQKRRFSRCPKTI